MKRRLSFDSVLLFALLCVLSAASLFIASRAKPTAEGKNPRRSTASPLPGGWKAFYVLLQERGANVARVEREPDQWPDDVDVMISGEVYSGLMDSPGSDGWTKAEIDAVRRWLRNGRTLIVLSGKSNKLLEAFDLPVADIGTRDATLFPLQPAPALAGVSGVTLAGQGRFRETPHEAVVLLADTDSAAVALRQGGGTLIAISDAALADNKHLTAADNARFLIGIIEGYAGRNGRIAFDEYHQGYQDQDDFWDAVGPSGAWITWQVILLMVIAAWSASRRFGLPRPLPEPSRVSSEYVASLAELYRRARAGGAAVESIYGAFRRDLSRAAGLATDAPDDELIPQAARALGAGDAATLEKRLASVIERSRNAIDSGTVAERDIVPLVREMETLRKELRLGGNDGAIPRH